MIITSLIQKLKNTLHSDLVNINNSYSKKDKFKYYFSKNIINQLLKLICTLLLKKEGLRHGTHKPVKISNKTIEKGKFLITRL